MNRSSLAWALLGLGFLPGIVAAAPSATVIALGGPTSASAGEKYGAIIYIVTNQGDAATPNTLLHFFLSTSPSPPVDSLKTAYANASHPQACIDTCFLVTRLLSPIEAGHSSSGSLTVRWISNWLSGTYYLVAMTDFWYFAEELTNVATMASPVVVAGPFLADLLVTALSAPTTMSAGQRYWITGTVANDPTATGTARNYDVGLYLSTDDLLSSDDTYLEVLAPGSLVPGQSVASSSLITIPNSMTGGTYRLIAKADRLGSVYESNEQNNVFVMPEPVVINGPFIPDLAVAALAGQTTASAGDPYTFSYTVANLSSAAPADDVHVGIYLSRDATLSTDDYKLIDTGIGNLTPGSAYSWNNLQLVLPTFLGGTYWLIAMVDPGSYLQGNITELNETNNILIMADPVMIDGPFIPDLAVTALNGPTLAFAGDPCVISFTVANLASLIPANDVHVGVYLSTDATLSSDDFELIDVGIGNLAPGSMATRNDLSLVLPTSMGGTYWLIAMVDPGSYFQGSITESSETNNVLIMADPIVVDGPYINNLQALEVITLSGPATALVGQPYEIQWSVTNSGQTALKGMFFIDLYLTDDVTGATNQIGLFSVGSLTPSETRSGTVDLQQIPILPDGTYYLAAKVRGEGTSVYWGNSVLVSMSALPPE